MKIDTNSKKIQELLQRNVDQIIPSGAELEKRLLSGRQLRIKFGIDPTGHNIHIGRAVVLWKLKEFQDLGHKIVLIIGDFTAQVGDPSDKLEKRPLLTPEQVKKNLKNYLKQIGMVIDIKKAEVRYNSEWLKKLKLQEISHLAEQFTWQQMSQRRNFKERIKNDQEISLRELFYPLMQGYDSVQVKADVELGGTDQLFNLLAGCKLQKRSGQIPQVVMMTKMLEGLDGRKMSTSWENVININDDPKEQFGKIMSMRDEQMAPYFELATSASSAELQVIEGELKQGVNPKKLKERLAFEIVKRYHGAQVASQAQKEFEKIFAQKETPDDAMEIVAPKGKVLMADFIATAKLVASKSEARRLIEQGGVKLNQNKVNDWKQTIQLKSGDSIQIGKRKFVRIG